MKRNFAGKIKTGWASTDITPKQTALITGQFHARISEGIMDPITATALAIESQKTNSNGRVIMISCDLVSIPDGFRDAVRTHLSKILPELKPTDIFLNATHTHAGPEVRVESDALQTGGGNVPGKFGIDIGRHVIDPADYIATASKQIAEAAATAWQNRAPSGIGFGLGSAVVGKNRRISYYNGETHMYGATNNPEFSHIEGYEDHSLNLLCTWDTDKKLTGMIVNIACPAQVSEKSFQISADFWHDTREELRRRLQNKALFILAQNSASGDQSPHILVNNKAEARMLYLKGLTNETPANPDYNLGSAEALRREIAIRIADAVTTILPYIEKDIDWSPRFEHHVETVNLSRRNLSSQDVKNALAEATKLREKHEKLKEDLDSHPEKKNEPRWYVEITSAYRKMKWNEAVEARFKTQTDNPEIPVETHVVRIGNAAFATNPFEYYLDYGMQIKARSPAVQTFLIQHVGSGTYLPSSRAVAGKSYGAIPASTPVGPEGGRVLAEKTVEIISRLMTET